MGTNSLILESIQQDFGKPYLRAVGRSRGIADRRFSAGSAAEFLHSAAMEFKLVTRAEAVAWAKGALRGQEIGQDWAARLAKSELLPYIIDSATMAARITLRFTRERPEVEKAIKTLKALGVAIEGAPEGTIRLKREIER